MSKALLLLVLLVGCAEPGPVEHRLLLWEDDDTQNVRCYMSLRGSQSLSCVRKIPVGTVLWAPAE